MTEKEYKISIRSSSYGKFSMVSFEHVQEIGIKYLEINPMDPGLLMDMMGDEDLDFKIGSLQFPINTSDPKIVDKFKNVCETYKDLDYEYFFSSTKFKGFGYADHASTTLTEEQQQAEREKGYRVLQKLGDVAQEYNKFISMETHPPYCTNAETMIETMKNVDHPAVKINFDTANIYYYNYLKIGEGIDEMKKVIEYIGTFHLKETDGKYEGWYFPHLGAERGIVDFKKVFDVMDEAGFDGIYCIEMEGTSEKSLDKLSMDAAKANVKASADHLRNIGILK